MKEPSCRWALPPSLNVPPDELVLRLDFYQTSILMHRFDKAEVQVKMVSPMDIIQALTQEVTISSGLLPDNALWWRTTREGWETALWRSPKVWRVALMVEALKPPRRFTLPMPGLIFLCKPGKPPSIWAAKKRPTLVQSPIYHAPVFNVFSDGRSCPGNHQYPVNLNQVPESFFLSYFSVAGNHHGRSQKYPNDLLKLWEELDGKQKYPSDDLVEAGTLEQLIGKEDMNNGTGSTTPHIQERYTGVEDGDEDDAL